MIDASFSHSIDPCWSDESDGKGVYGDRAANGLSENMTRKKQG